MKTNNGKKIRALMILADVSGAEIARKLKVHRTMVNKVVNGDRKSPRVRKAIARALNIDVKDLWPQ
jgi:transcriptional regulator with XRE-family HTH domain